MVNAVLAINNLQSTLHRTTSMQSMKCSPAPTLPMNVLKVSAHWQQTWPWGVVVENGDTNLQIAGSRATSVKIGSHNDYSILQCARTKRQPAAPLRKKTYQQVEVGTKVQMNLAIARGIVTP